MNRSFFERSLVSLKESRGTSFLIPLGADRQAIRIVVDGAAAEWIRVYKSDYWRHVVGIARKDGSDAFLDGYAVLCYFYDFVANDIVILHNCLPERMTELLDLGAGIGLMDVFLYQDYDRRVSLTMTELATMSEIDFVDQPTVALPVPLRPIDALEKVVKCNDLRNCEVVDGALIGNLAGRKFDCVVSMRSWGYLYDLDVYMPVVDRTLAANGVVITDLSAKYDSERKFKSYFADCRMIVELGNGRRWMGRRK